MLFRTWSLVKSESFKFLRITYILRAKCKHCDSKFKTRCNKSRRTVPVFDSSQGKGLEA